MHRLSSTNVRPGAADRDAKPGNFAILASSVTASGLLLTEESSERGETYESG